jgi:hypothetical protein
MSLKCGSTSVLETSQTQRPEIRLTHILQCEQHEEVRLLLLLVVVVLLLLLLMLLLYWTWLLSVALRARLVLAE